MLQVFRGKENIGVLTKTGNTTVQLSNTNIVFGAKQYETGNLVLDINTTGLGGLEVSKQNLTFYYVYLVDDGINPYLIGSTSEQKPSGYSKYKKVGAFYTDGSGNIFKAYSLGYTVPQRYSFKYDTSLLDINHVPSDWISSVVKSGTANHLKTCSIASGTFSSVPNYFFGNLNNGDSSVCATTETTSTISFRTRDLNNTNVDRECTVNAIPTGLDAIQPDWTDY